MKKMTIMATLFMLAFSLLVAAIPAHADGTLQPALGACILQQNGNWYKLRYTFTVRGTTIAGQLFTGQYLGAWRADAVRYRWYYRALLPNVSAQKTWTFDVPFWEQYKPTMIASVGNNTAALYNLGAISLPYCTGYGPQDGIVTYPPDAMRQYQYPKILVGVNYCVVQESGDWHQLRYTFIERNETNRIIRHATFDATFDAAMTQGGTVELHQIHVNFPTLPNHTFRQWTLQQSYWLRGRETDTVGGEYRITQPDDPLNARKITWSEVREFREIPFCTDDHVTQSASTFPLFLPSVFLLR